MSRTLFTRGYQQRTIDDFVSILVSSRIDVPVDVRETARSHKPGFSKSVLQAALLAHGLPQRRSAAEQQVRDRGASPENEHPLDEVELQSPETVFESRLRLRKSLFDLRIKAREVQLVHFP
jgi:hypothetical protein